VLTLRHLRELKALDAPDRRDALMASQDALVAAARDHDFVEFTNRVTVWLINHTTSDEVQEQVKKTSCTWNTNTDGSIDGRFHLDPLSAAAVGAALGDEMQRLFRQHQHMLRRDPRLRNGVSHQQFSKMSGIGLVGLGPFLVPSPGRGVGRLGHVRPKPGGLNLLGHIPPTGASLQRELPGHGAELGQPIS
jgi:hypothetical protein